jgi:hypothetical protein
MAGRDWKVKQEMRNQVNSGLPKAKISIGENGRKEKKTKRRKKMQLLYIPALDSEEGVSLVQEERR